MRSPVKQAKIRLAKHLLPDARASTSVLFKNTIMRKLIVFVFMLVTMVASAQTTNIVGCVTFAWGDINPPATQADPSYHYNFYHSTNILVPLTNWVKIATVASGVTNLPVNIPAGTHYFFVTAQDWWSESPPSNIASTNTPAMLSALTLSIESLSRTNGP
jgi:hypothetical protein